MDGRLGYSEVARLAFGEVDATAKIMNNPVSNGLLQLLVTKAGFIGIFNTRGQLLLSRQLNAGINTIDVSGFTNGIYLLKTENETLKFIKR